MKKYSDLNSLQKDFAVDKALAILVNTLITKEFDYQFNSPLAQKHFFDALQYDNTKSEFDAVMESDEIAEELYPIAESMAETAYYPIEGECVLEGIAGQ